MSDIQKYLETSDVTHYAPSGFVTRNVPTASAIPFHLLQNLLEAFRRSNTAFFVANLLIVCSMSENGLCLPSYECVYGRLMRFFVPERLEEGLAIKLADEDIVLSSGPKSGTTWAQQVVPCSAVFLVA